MARIQIYLSEKTSKILAARCPTGTDDDLYAAFRELAAVESLCGGGRERAPNWPGEPAEDGEDAATAAMAVRIAQILADGKTYTTGALAQLLPPPLNWRLLMRVARAHPELASHTGAEKSMYGRMVRGWLWHLQ